MSQKQKNAAEEKEKLKKAKAQLNEMVYEAKKKIIEGDMNQAHDELYRFISEQKEKLGGDDSVFLLPGLFTLAEVHIIEGRLKKAEQYLNAAHWSFLKSNDKNQMDKRREKGIVLTPEEQITYKINLHRTFAKLYEVKNDYKEAINELKQSTYLESKKYGPENPYVALNYFLLGKIFIDMNNQQIGESFFAKVAEIWYRYLKKFFDKTPEEQQTFLIEQLSLEQAINYLTFIQKHFEEAYDDQQAGVVFTPVMRTFYSIGLLYRIFGDDTQCEAYLKQVYRQCSRYLPEDDQKTQKIKSMLIGMNVNLEEVSMVRTPKDENQLMQGGEPNDDIDGF